MNVRMAAAAPATFTVNTAARRLAGPTVVLGTPSKGRQHGSGTAPFPRVTGPVPTGVAQVQEGQRQ